MAVGAVVVTTAVLVIGVGGEMVLCWPYSLALDAGVDGLSVIFDLDVDVDDDCGCCEGGRGLPVGVLLESLCGGAVVVVVDAGGDSIPEDPKTASTPRLTLPSIKFLKRTNGFSSATIFQQKKTRRR